jgi:hypothetical protein
MKSLRKPTASSAIHANSRLFSGNAFKSVMTISPQTLTEKLTQTRKDLEACQAEDAYDKKRQQLHIANYKRDILQLEKDIKILDESAFQN